MRSFTKWPRLIVAGKPVTREQANEILLRTNGYMHTNDRAWAAAIGRVLGIEVADYGLDWKSEHAFMTSIGGLDLHYLHNARIMSPWVGGPHGWCDWDGAIGCRNYNIGKWPEAAEVTEDWGKIAAAFPYLELRAQVVTDEGEGEIAAEWAVAEGKAALVEPIGPIAQPEDITADEGAFLTRFFGYGAERGVALERLAEAVRQVRDQADHGTAENTPVNDSAAAAAPRED